jgi:hypothetical protein
LDVAGIFLTHTSPILFCTRARKLNNLFLLANFFLLKKREKTVHGAGFTVHDSVETQCIAPRHSRQVRAESPVINSTGQRPVNKGNFSPIALKGRNPVIDSIPPFQVGCTKVYYAYLFKQQVFFVF